MAKKKEVMVAIVIKASRMTCPMAGKMIEQAKQGPIQLPILVQQNPEAGISHHIALHKPSRLLHHAEQPFQVGPLHPHRGAGDISGYNVERSAHAHESARSTQLAEALDQTLLLG